MILNIQIPFEHTYGTGIKTEKRNIVSIRVKKYEGAGTAVVCYEAKDIDGNWYNILKKIINILIFQKFLILKSGKEN